jgi:hypothetical protein
MTKPIWVDITTNRKIGAVSDFTVGSGDIEFFRITDNLEIFITGKRVIEDARPANQRQPHEPKI